MERKFGRSPSPFHIPCKSESGRYLLNLLKFIHHHSSALDSRSVHSHPSTFPLVTTTSSIKISCIARAAAMMEPEPIPLRTLIVLLSYELVISDPRYKGVRLMK